MGGRKSTCARKSTMQCVRDGLVAMGYRVASAVSWRLPVQYARVCVYVCDGQGVFLDVIFLSFSNSGSGSGSKHMACPIQVAS